MIDPTAVIHPTACIEGDVRIGARTIIGPFCYLKGPVVIGDDNVISSHVCIGQDAEHRTKPSVGTIYIGDRNQIRELSVIQRGTGERPTTIQNDCYIMNQTYIAHDCLIESGVTIASETVMGGHTVIQHDATIGLNCSIHQHSTIGAYAMVGMGAVVTKDIPPFLVAAGNPAKSMRINTHQLTTALISEGEITFETDCIAYRSDKAVAICEQFKKVVRRDVLVKIDTAQEI